MPQEVTVRGTSDVPMILGIIGAVVSLPNLLCAGVCGAVAGGAMAGEAGAGIGSLLGFVPIVLGFIAAFMGKSNPVFCGLGMIICAVISLIVVIMTGFLSVFGWAALILFLLAGIFAFTQPKEEVVTSAGGVQKKSPNQGGQAPQHPDSSPRQQQIKPQPRPQPPQPQPPKQPQIKPQPQIQPRPQPPRPQPPQPQSPQPAQPQLPQIQPQPRTQPQATPANVQQRPAETTPAAGRAAATTPMLVGITGLFANQSLDLGQWRVSIGRDPRLVQLVYPQNNEEISRRHCTVYYDEKIGRFCLEDSSTNGTFLGSNERLKGGRTYYLSSGERFYLVDPKETFEVRL